MSKRIAAGDTFPDPQGNNREVGYKKPPAHQRWQKGQSGNPAGRPRSAVLSDAYRRMLAEADPEDEQGRTRAEVIAEQMYLKAKGGDVSAMREIADRVEGKARQNITFPDKEKDRIERAIQGVMEESGCSREEAIEALSLFRPEVSRLPN